jgi:hypothetical protein
VLQGLGTRVCLLQRRLAHWNLLTLQHMEQLSQAAAVTAALVLLAAALWVPSQVPTVPVVGAVVAAVVVAVVVAEAVVVVSGRAP